jgi:hypothetical protein
MTRRTFRQLLSLAIFGLLFVSGQVKAEEASGLLKVTTDKGAATVYIGIDQIGETPVSEYLGTGSYTIRVLKDGFEPFVRKIHIRPDQATTVSARLYPGDGSVEFLVEPSGAELTLNGGKETWTTPVRLRDLKERKYAYTITAPGHEIEKSSFTFQKGKNLLLTARLQSSAGLVSVLSRPRGASVLLDGEPMGQTPLALEEIESGLHTVLIKKKGYASIFRRIDTSDGSKGEVEARLPKSGAPLAVRTGNPEARLSVQGMALGPQANYSFGPVERGRYQLVVSAPGMKTIDQTVEVPISGSAVYRARLRPKDGTSPSVLAKGQPFYKHWGFYTAIGSAVLAGTAAALLSTSGGGGATQTSPTGDILVSLP